MDAINLGDALDQAEFPDEVAKLRQQMMGFRQDIEQLFEGQCIADKGDLENAKRIAAHWRVNLILQLATLTHLIDAKIISIDEAVSRIEHIQSVFGQGNPSYAQPMVLMGTKLATDWLRSHKKQLRPAWQPEVIQGGLDNPEPS